MSCPAGSLSSDVFYVPCVSECVACSWSCRWICGRTRRSCTASLPCESSSVSDNRRTASVSSHRCRTCTTCPLWSRPCGGPGRVWPSGPAERTHGHKWCRCRSPPPRTAAPPGPRSPAGRYLKLDLKLPRPGLSRTAGPRCRAAGPAPSPLRSHGRYPACFSHRCSGSTGTSRCSALTPPAEEATAPPPPPPPWREETSSRSGPNWSSSPAAQTRLPITTNNSQDTFKNCSRSHFTTCEQD